MRRTEAQLLAARNFETQSFGPCDYQAQLKEEIAVEEEALARALYTASLSTPLLATPGAELSRLRQQIADLEESATATRPAPRKALFGDPSAFPTFHILDIPAEMKKEE